MKKEYYKRVTAEDVLVKCIDNNNNYSIASRNNPEPDGYTNHSWENKTNWEQITAEEASEILGYDVTE